MDQYYQPRPVLGYTAEGQPVYELPGAEQAGAGHQQGYAKPTYAQGYDRQGYQEHGYAAPTSQQPSHEQPAYPPASDGAPVYAAPPYGSRKTNGLAIATLVLSLVLGFIAIPFGHVAKAQIRRTGEQGSRLATAGLVLGYLSLTVVIALGSFLAYVTHQANNAQAAARLNSNYSQLYATGSPAPDTSRAYGSSGSSNGNSNAYGSSNGATQVPSSPGGYAYSTPTATRGATTSSGQWSAAYQVVAVPVAGAYWQGFVSDAGARCNALDPAVLVAANDTSRVAVCLTADHRYYYRGSRISDGAALELEDPTPTSNGFLANNKGTTYDISSAGLIITSPSGTVTSASSWTAYWTTN